MAGHRSAGIQGLMRCDGYPDLVGVRAEVEAEEVVFRFEGASALAALRREVRVPYRDIAVVEVREPRWPPTLPRWRVGTHLPGVWAMGVFRYRSHWRFLYFGLRTKRVLALTLMGNRFHEVEIDVAEPDALAEELRRRAPS